MASNVLVRPSVSTNDDTTKLTPMSTANDVRRKSQLAGGKVAEGETKDLAHDGYSSSALIRS